MSSRPNILWIVTTQWRAQACGYAGDPNARTPQLDAFARGATHHAQAVTPHPFGPFARAALLTGVPCPDNGVRDYFDPLPAETRTIAHGMGERGYATGFFGKWHLGRRDPAAPLVGEAHARTRVPPDARGGFEMWEGFESGFLLNNPWLHGTRLAEPTPFHGYQPAVLVERAAGWWREFMAAGRPWFCVLSFETPHPPYDAPAEGHTFHPDEILLPPNVPRGGEVEAKARRELAGYYAHIAATDAVIGRAVGLARASAPQRELCVVIASVHGDMHGAHGLFRKGWPHEESVRVPLLVQTPGGPAGVRDDTAVSLIDLPRMALGWADGKAVTLARDDAAISMPSVVALPHQCDRRWHGFRSPRRKLVLNADGSPWLHFDLERDPGETRNLVGDPGFAAELRASCDRLARKPPA